MNTVQSNEILARFIVNEGWINPLSNQVKGDAFIPRKDGGQLKTSVTRHDGKDVEVVKNRGTKFLEAPRNKPIKLFGWANVMAGAVRAVSTIPSLEIEAAGSKIDPNHANIVGWDLDFGKQWLQAEEIAQQSKYSPC